MYVTGVAPQYADALPSKLHSLPQRSHRSPLTSLILKLNDAQFCLAGGSNLSHDTEFVESFFAVGKVGAVNVPLNWRLVPDELEFILADAGVRVLVYGAEFEKVATELRERGTSAI